VAGQAAEIEWREGGVPVSVRFDDPYFSLAGGLDESRHVFLEGNGLPARFAPGFRIAELGFGSGLNLLAALAAWRGAQMRGRLSYTAFEAYPLDPATMARAHAAFPELADLSTARDSALRTRGSSNGGREMFRRMNPVPSPGDERRCPGRLLSIQRV
jgi:tRNA U34 5-methylaminomethyl-2-thiouridine-forming methyltransferase MnmC